MGFRAGHLNAAHKRKLAKVVLFRASMVRMNEDQFRHCDCKFVTVNYDMLSTTRGDAVAAAKLLPKFDQPPVVETVLSVQFDSLPRFKAAHLGLFLSHLGDEWGNASDAPPLPPQFERFEPVVQWEHLGIQFEVSQEIALRMQVRNKGKDRMIQLQNGRLSLNWLGEAGQSYPSYRKVRPDFESVLGQFRRFVSASDLGEIRPNQWEVTYLNHIPKGTVWNGADDWARPFRLLIACPGHPRGIKPESFAGEWHYEIEPQRGRLHVQLKNAWRRRQEAEEILLLTLTARGPIKDGGNDSEILSGLDLGHETIVGAFADLTTETAHEFWRRTQ